MRNFTSDHSNKIEETLIAAAELGIGMYVCKLDKPWKDSPFIFQGFYIQNQNILQQVKDECQFVYIDTTRQGSSIPIRFSPANIADKPRSPIGNYPRHSNSSEKKLVVDKKGLFSKTISLLIKNKDRNKVNYNFLQDIIDNKINVKSIQSPKKVNSFEQEIDKAQYAHLNARQVIQGYISGVKKGGTIDIQMANKVVQDCMYSVLRAPDAMMLMTHLKVKDNDTWCHSMNTCVLAIAFGRHLNLNKNELIVLGFCGILHDIGKIRLPDAILAKSNSLSVNEELIMQSHTTLGRDMLTSYVNNGGMITDILNNSGRHNAKQAEHEHWQTILKANVLTECPKELELTIAEVAHSHHERLDGRGYPRRLTDKQISPYAKVIAIVDAYDSLTIDRPNQKGKTHLQAVDFLLNRGGSYFDETLVSCFIQSLGAFPAGSVVEMNSGEIGIVIEVNQQKKLRPKIILVSDNEKKPQAQKRIINLAQAYHDEWGKPYSVKAIIRQDTYNIDLNQYYNYGEIQKILSQVA